MPKIIEFLAFGEPLGITLIVISVFGALVTIGVGVGDSCSEWSWTRLTLLFNHFFVFVFGKSPMQVVFALKMGTPLVKANDALLSFSLLFSLVVTILCSIVFLGEPQDWSCMTSQVALALGFALCLSSIMSGSNF